MAGAQSTAKVSTQQHSVYVELGSCQATSSLKHHRPRMPSNERTFLQHYYSAAHQPHAHTPAPVLFLSLSNNLR